MKKKLYSAILASIMVIGSICGVAIPVYAKEETKIIDGNDSYDTATYLDINGSYSDVLADSYVFDFYMLTPDSNGKLSIHFGHTYGDSSDGWEVITYKYQDGEYLELSDTVIQLKDNENIELPFVGAQQGCKYYIKVKGYSIDINITMKDVNPIGFTYGDTSNEYVYYFTSIDNAYFLSAYGKTNYLEDRAVIFSDLMTRTFTKDYYADSTPINKKAKLISSQIKEHFNTLSNTGRYYWDRFL